MKRYKTVFSIAIAVAMVVAAVVPINVRAMEENTYLSADTSHEVSLESVSDSDMDSLISEKIGVVSGGDATEEVIVTVDVSDMVYQSGGWGTPIKENTIALYALDVTDEREQLKEAISEALQEEARTLDISGYNLILDDWEELIILYAEVLNEHPELFYVSSEIRYSYYVGMGKLASLYFSYIGTTSEERQAYTEKVELAVKGITSDMTDMEKALVLHDYLAQHCAYAYTEYLEGNLDNCPNVYNAYGALVEGRAVCQGYAVAYNSLLRAVGIPSEVCSSTAMNHAWNIILLDGEWYHVDVTWDDPVWNVEGRAMHSYFLLSDSEMGNREHHDWSSTVICTSSKYDASDYWWNVAESQIVLGDKQYYIEEYYDRSGSVFRLAERDGDVTTTKYVNNTLWRMWEGTGFWQGSFSYLSKQGDYIYFNDKLNLYAMELTDSMPQIVYTYEGGDGYIYGAMVYEDGTARLNIDTSPNRTSDSFVTVDLSAEAPTLTVDYQTGIISTTENMEYSIDGGATWSRCAENMKIMDLGWNGIRDVTVSFRITESGGRFVSDTTVVTLKALPGVLSGKVTCLGDGTVSTNLQLLDSTGAVVAVTSVKGTGKEYVMEDVSPGTYILQVSAQNHVTREYMVTVGEEAVSQDVALYLTGDVNGDGVVNAKDKKVLYNHIASLALLEGYNLKVADVNEDGMVNAKDKKMLYNHIAGIFLLW